MDGSSDDDNDERLPFLKSESLKERNGNKYGSVGGASTSGHREAPGMCASSSGDVALEEPLERLDASEEQLCTCGMEVTVETSRVSVWSILWAYRKTILLIVTPLACLPLLLVIGDGPSKGAFVIIIMAVYWIFELLPLAVTSLLPVILYPLLGVQDSDDVCRNYLKDTNFLFVGGLIVAVAVEHWDVHRRFALGVLLLMGAKIRWLILGFMLVTAFLSMWISNTATTAMMVPIAQSVVIQLLDQKRENERKREARRLAKLGVDVNAIEIEDTPTDKPSTSMDETAFTGNVNRAFNMAEDTKHLTDMDMESVIAENEAEMKAKEAQDERAIDIDSLSPEDRKLCKVMLLCVAYAANIGGTATLTGTGPNVVLGGVVDELYGEEAGVTFASWILFSLPGTIVNLFLCWIWLQAMFIGFKCNSNSEEVDEETKREKEEERKSTRNVLKLEYKKLGPWTWGQIAVVCHFTVLACLWLFRNPTFIPGSSGWAGLFPVSDYISDATAAIIISIALFIFPAYPPWFLRCKPFKMEDDAEPKMRGALLDWKTTQRMLPWNVILLLGGGFALADGTAVSGLSAWLADQFAVLDFLPPWVFVLIITIVICLFTEFTSNVATATIFLPILAALAESICINPLYIMLPATISCSYAFMLPVATPPNAIAFAYGSITVPDMMRAGSAMNVIGILIVNVLINSMGIVVFDVLKYPAWAGNTDFCLGVGINMTTPMTTPNTTCVC